MGPKISVLLGIDLPSLCARVAKLFKSTPDLHVVGIASNELESRRLVKTCRPVVAVAACHGGRMHMLVQALFGRVVFGMAIHTARVAEYFVHLHEHRDAVGFRR